MKKAVLLLFIFSLLAVSCTKDDTPEPQETERTVFMYLPWSTNLAAHFAKNLADIETALRDNILKNNRLLVFLSTSSTEAIMFELEYKDGKNTRTTLKEYTNPAFTTATGITSIVNDVRYFAPASRYAMIIGSHGMAWLPVQQEQSTLKLGREKDYWEYEGVPETRFFGGTTPEYQTDITTLANGIAGAGIKMDYILFDDCYMSSIEVAYELKHVTDYLIASPTEVMVYGFPYHKIGRYLIGNIDLQGICSGFYEFYKDYQYPYGTIGVTVCAELDALAAVMKEMNSRFSFDPALLNEVQRMDGYYPVVFFDLGDYVAKLCVDTDLLDRFENQLERTVPSGLSMHTGSYYSMTMGAIEIKAFSGITISDPSINVKAVEKNETAWYKATH